MTLTTDPAGAVIRCRCPKCFGKRWPSVFDWYEEHGRGQVLVLDSEVSIELRGLTDGGRRFRGVEEEGTEDQLQVLVVVWANGLAEVSYRKGTHETWSAPTLCAEVEY